MTTLDRVRSTDTENQDVQTLDDWKTSDPVSEVFELVREIQRYIIQQRDLDWDGVPYPPDLTWGMDVSAYALNRMWHEQSRSTQHQSQQATKSVGDERTRENNEFRIASFNINNALATNQHTNQIRHNTDQTLVDAQNQGVRSQDKTVQAVRDAANASEQKQIDREIPSYEIVHPPPELQIKADLSISITRPQDEHHREKITVELLQLKSQREHCTRCLAEHRERCGVLSGEGAYNSRLLIITEEPDQAQTQAGTWWAGQQGTLLANILKAIGLRPEQIYITAIISCAQPEDHTVTWPHSDKIASCRSYWQKELELLQPEFLISLGTVATQILLNKTQRLPHLRGRWHPFHNMELFPTFSPNYLLKHRAYKKQAWEDWQKIRERLIEIDHDKNN